MKLNRDGVIVLLGSPLVTKLNLHTKASYLYVCVCMSSFVRFCVHLSYFGLVVTNLWLAGVDYKICFNYDALRIFLVVRRNGNELYRLRIMRGKITVERCGLD